MKNAHTRIGTIEYAGGTPEQPTKSIAWFDKFAKDEDGFTQMISIFGNDAEVAALRAALIERRVVTAITPDGKSYVIDMGDKLSIYKGHIQIPDRPRPVRHLVVLSQPMVQNGLDGGVFLFNRRSDIAWATIISFLGLPSAPEWADQGMRWLEANDKVTHLESFGCSASVAKVSRDELLEWIGNGVRDGELNFPQKPGPILWPRYTLHDLFSEDLDDNTNVGLAEAA